MRFHAIEFRKQQWVGNKRANKRVQEAQESHYEMSSRENASISREQEKMRGIVCYNTGEIIL